MKHDTEIGKVIGYESEYIDSSDPGSYDDTIEGTSSDEARRHKSIKKHYNPNVLLEDLCLDPRFPNLKLFKKELVQFSTSMGFEFKYIKNDAIRVKAQCSGKRYSLLILCWWSLVRRR